MAKNERADEVPIIDEPDPDHGFEPGSAQYRGVTVLMKFPGDLELSHFGQLLMELFLGLSEDRSKLGIARRLAEVIHDTCDAIVDPSDNLRQFDVLKAIEKRAIAQGVWANSYPEIAARDTAGAEHSARIAHVNAIEALNLMQIASRPKNPEIKRAKWECWGTFATLCVGRVGGLLGSPSYWAAMRMQGNRSKDDPRTEIKRLIHAEWCKHRPYMQRNLTAAFIRGETDPYRDPKSRKLPDGRRSVSQWVKLWNSWGDEALDWEFAKNIREAKPKR